jgi:hypothetical protein
MGKFILGIIVTLLVLILGGLGFAMLGFFPTAANVDPPHIESHLLMSAQSTPPWSATLPASPTHSLPPTRISKTA